MLPRLITPNGRRPRGRMVLGAMLSIGVVAALLSATQVATSSAAPSARAVASSSLAAGGEHSCAVTNGGQLWCWGNNAYGQVGNGVQGPGPKAPYRIGTNKTWRRVAAGGASSCAIDTSANLYCWGLNNEGQLGLGDRKIRTAPTQVAGTDWDQLSVGWFTACGVKTDNTAWCWGDNSARQLGDGTTTRRNRPLQVAGSWESISAGFQHTCGIKTNGTLWCWGRNTFGQVGNGTTADARKPTKIGVDTTWTDVSTSFTHTCGVRGGEIRCWGRNSRGQLGDGTRRTRVVATPVAPGLPPMKDVAAAEGSTCALTSTGGDLWCWGSNRYGALGNGQPTSSNKPVPGQGSYEQLSAGWMHVCGRTTTGTKCWGNNERGQVGDASVTDRRSPTDQTWPSGAARTADVGVSAPRVVLGEGSASAPSTTRKKKASFNFRIASYNTLGDVHTRPYTHDDEYAPSRIRSEWAQDLFAEMGSPSIIGLQEVERSQLLALRRATNNTFAVWPGEQRRGGLQQSLLFRKSVWRATSLQTIRIPFIGQTRAQPVVRLQHRATGRSIWVINAHNAPRDLQKQRNQAVRKEIAKIKKLRQTGLPVFFMGDLNEKRTVFCKVVKKTDLRSPLGGRYSKKTGCREPRGMRVDWMFGSKDVDFTAFSMYTSPLRRWATDHVTVPVGTVHVP